MGSKQSHRPVRAATTVAHAIVADIRRSGYGPGVRLPSVPEMLERYDVSNGTLKEALRFLEFTGVIVMKPGPSGGAIVSEPDSHFLARSLALVLEFHQTSFRTLVDLRLILEPLGASIAAQNASPETLRDLTNCVEEMARQIDNEEEFLLQNEHFHELVIEGSGNSVFALLVSSFSWITDGSPLGVHYPIERRQAVLEAHVSILNAIQSRDPVAASEAMRTHILQFVRYLETHYQFLYDGVVKWGDVSL
jgi:GntR family transcriptional regulator, transcriptional repressor for pyruvate dehydrogenase complex